MALSACLAASASRDLLSIVLESVFKWMNVLVKLETQFTRLERLFNRNAKDGKSVVPF